MRFSPFASQSKLTALTLVVAGGMILAACDSTVEGGGTGSGGGESSATGIAQGGSDAGSGGAESSSVSASGGAGPGASTAIALFAYELPQGQGGVDVSVGVGAGGAGGEGGAESVAVAVGTGVGGAPAGEGGAGVTVGGGEGGYGSSGVGQGVTVGGGEGGYGSSGVGGSDPGWDLDRLFLFISDDIVECADPYGVDTWCGPRQFRASIGLPIEYQQVGIYSLDDPAIIASFSAWEGDGQQCIGGGGSFFDGTIEVLSIDANVVRVRLAGTSPADVDGVHDVIRCSGGQPPEETSVLGYFPSLLPPGESGSSVQGAGGSGPGPDTFILDFADHAQSCPDPYADQPGPGELHESFSIHLPSSYLVPGVYSLSDPAITSIYTQMEENTAAVGGGSGGEPGTLTIFQVTDAFIDLQLEGSSHAFANGGGQVPRCN